MYAGTKHSGWKVIISIISVKDKRVLYIGGFDLPDRNAAAQRVVSNSKLLRDLGYEVVLVGLAKDVIDEQISFNYEGFTCFNLKYPHSFGDWLKYLCSIKRYRHFIDRISPTLVIAYNHPAVALKKLYSYNKNRGIKTISDCTEWYSAKGNLIKALDTKYRMERVQCQIDGVIAISEYLYSYYSSKNCKVVQLPPLVDKQEKKWHQPIANKDEIVITYAGSIGEAQKDSLSDIVSIIGRIREMHNVPLVFNVIGVSKEQYSEVLSKNGTVEQSDYVKFYGRVPHTMVLEVLSKSDYSIFVRHATLTNTAGFPTKFVEAISAGALVITNKSSNISDFLVDGVNGFILDFSSLTSLEESLLIPLMKSKSDIKKMREDMNTNLFDYRSYVPIVQPFLSSL